MKGVLLARDSARLKAELAGTGGKVRVGEGDQMDKAQIHGSP